MYYRCTWPTALSVWRFRRPHKKRSRGSEGACRVTRHAPAEMRSACSGPWPSCTSTPYASSRSPPPTKQLLEPRCRLHVHNVIFRHSPRPQQHLDQVRLRVELAHEHALGFREKLRDAHGNRAFSVVKDVVGVIREGVLQTPFHDFPERKHGGGTGKRGVWFTGRRGRALGERKNGAASTTSVRSMRISAYAVSGWWPWDFLSVANVPNMCVCCGCFVSVFRQWLHRQ